MEAAFTPVLLLLRVCVPGVVGVPSSVISCLPISASSATLARVPAECVEPLDAPRDSAGDGRAPGNSFGVAVLVAAALLDDGAGAGEGAADGTRGEDEPDTASDFGGVPANADTAQTSKQVRTRDAVQHNHGDTPSRGSTSAPLSNTAERGRSWPCESELPVGNRARPVPDGAVGSGVLRDMLLLLPNVTPNSDRGFFPSLGARGTGAGAGAGAGAGPAEGPLAGAEGDA